jgi:hypothetical protein
VKTEDVISAALRQAGETGLTRTEIRDLFSRHCKGDEIDAALTALAANGKAKRIVGATTGGPPPIVWIEQGNGKTSDNSDRSDKSLPADGFGRLCRSSIGGLPGDAPPVPTSHPPSCAGESTGC